jgi:alpha-tubulin suppressor-like RCC1 family protein
MDSGPDICGTSTTSPCSTTPIAVSGLYGVTALAAGASHGLALLKNGTVMAWGNNQHGELGDGTTTRATHPVPVSGLSGVTAIAAGGFHSLALLSNGTVMAWGDNDSGQAAGGTFSGPHGSFAGPDSCGGLGTPCSTTPALVSGLSGVTAIAAGGDFSLALLSNGTVRAWGDGSYGDLGNGSVGLPNGTDSGTDNCAEEVEGIFPAWCSPTPVPVSGLSGVTAIAAGEHNALALLGNRAVMAWGLNDVGELGDGTSTGPDECYALDGLLFTEIPCATTPVAVAELGPAAAVSTSGANGLVLGVTGSVAAWGLNSGGELGDGAHTGPDTCSASHVACSTKPVLVSGITEATAITAGVDFGLALLSNGTVQAWGINDGGALGDGNDEPTTGCGCVDAPVAVSELSEVTALAPEGNAVFSLALRGGFIPPASPAGSSPSTAPPTASSPPTPPLAGPVKLSRTISGSGLQTLSLTNPNDYPVSASIKETAQLIATAAIAKPKKKPKGTTIIVATRTAKIAAHKTVKIKLKLSNAALELLRKHRRLNTAVKITLTAPERPAKVVSKSIVLRLAHG